MSLNFRAMGSHARSEKRFGNCALTCQSEFRKLLVLSSWYIRIGIQPILQCIEITKPKSDLHESGQRDVS